MATERISAQLLSRKIGNHIYGIKALANVLARN